jgi:Flp pilus assembly protein CpaB
MARNRSSMLITIGAAVFVLGASLAFLAVRSGNDKPSAQVKTAATVPVAKAGDVVAAGAAVPSFEIPKGKQAVAISMAYVPGVAGFVKAHDKVNVFGTIKPGSPVPKGALAPTPLVKMILSDVEVLYVSAPAAAAPTTFILALTPTDAEQVVYFQTFEGLYLSLARTDQGILTTPGRAAGAPF